MNDSKKVSINFENYKTPEDIEKLFTEIAKQMKNYHNKNFIIGDFTTDNIYIGDDEKLGFNHTIGFKEHPEPEQENDGYKYLILLMSAYLQKTEDKEIKDKLKENSKLNMDDVIDFYSHNKKNLPKFRKFYSIINTSSKNEEVNDNESNNQNNNKSKGIENKSLVKSNGHSLVPNDKFKPNGFVTLFVFPFVMIYLFLILALLYWMIVLN